MKAIVITFSGKIQNEGQLMESLAEVVGTFTSANSVNADLLHDNEVATALTKCISDKRRPCTAPANDPKLEVIKDFCKKIVAETGPTALKKNEILCGDICKYLIRQNRAVIASPISIIMDIPSEPNRKEYEEVLKSYGLSLLPGLLRDINPIFKFY